MKEIANVLENYLSTKSALGGKATNAHTIDQQSLQKILPAFFVSILTALGREDEFKVEGSFGNGVIAGVPWVAVFNNKITGSAQNGYYIVLLFSEDMNSCYLSLNQGVTEFKKQYSGKIALQKIKVMAARALNYFIPDEAAVVGPIDLAAEGHLGRGYERGAIESYRYELAGLPDESIVEEHFRRLLSHYDALVSIVGVSLRALAPVNEEQYQQAVLEKASLQNSDKKEAYSEPNGGLPVPPRSLAKGAVGYVRNPDVAAAALGLADFKCEIASEHDTFISSAKGLPYLEAHHLVPMGKQSDHPFSLDVVANVVALCPKCHKLLHHGRAADKRKPLIKLLHSRLDKLTEKEINIDEKILLKYYGTDLLDDEI